jgi:Flp pilus assembly protein CpaB
MIAAGGDAGALWTAKGTPEVSRLRCRVMPLASRPIRPGLRSLRRRWRGFLVLHRRLLVALAVGLAVLSGLRALSPPLPVSNQVVVALHDLPGGRVLATGDVTVRRLPAEVTPAGAVADVSAVAGLTLAAPVRAGEVVTDRRVLGEGLLAAHPGSVAIPVRVPDTEVRELLRVGDRIDLVAASPRGPATVVAEAAPVLALPRPAGGGVGANAGALVVVAVPEHDSLEVTSAAAAGVVGVVLLG